MDSKLPGTYLQILEILKTRIRDARIKAIITANVQLLAIYWEIGHTISEQEKQQGWGAKIVEQLARDLKREFPDFKGLSARNLRYMRDFALGWPELKVLQRAAATMDLSQILQQAAAKLPWFHICTLLDKVKTTEERKFYAFKAIENGWSRNTLIHQIESKLIQRQGKAITNFELTLPKAQSDLAKESIKNPYLFDFVGMGEEMQERELERTLIQHIKKFMLELGKGYAYVGNQFNLNVSGDDYFLDLLFYNYHIHCFVVFELKVGDFKPEYAGKLNFYINTINDQLKGTEDRPTIGVLLCKTPNETVVKYALQGINAPMGVTEFHFNNEYRLTEAIPENLKSELPTIEALEHEMDREVDLVKKPFEQKLEQLKGLMLRTGKEQVQKEKDNNDVWYIFKDVVPQLEEEIKRNLKPIVGDFTKVELSRRINNLSSAYLMGIDLEKHLQNDNVNLIGLSLRMEGFKRGGVDSFGVWKELFIEFHQFKYGIGNEQYRPWIEKLYHQKWTKEEIQELAEKWCEEIIDDITEKVGKLL
jgi:predicted nuclease of restriction endonuclease-like (RecB) superfamily